MNRVFSFVLPALVAGLVSGFFGTPVARGQYSTNRRPIAPPGYSVRDQQKKAFDNEWARLGDRTCDFGAQFKGLKKWKSRIDAKRPSIRTKQDTMRFNRDVEAFNARLDELNLKKERLNRDYEDLDRRWQAWKVKQQSMDRRSKPANPGRITLTPDARKKGQ